MLPFAQAVAASKGETRDFSFGFKSVKITYNTTNQDGENVEDNHGIGASLSLGRTEEWKQFTRSIGLFADAISFQDNHSFCRDR